MIMIKPEICINQIIRNKTNSTINTNFENTQ